MLNITCSLALLSGLVSMAFAANPTTQSDIISTTDQDWANAILQNPILSSSNSSNTLVPLRNLSSITNLSDLGPIQCFANAPLPARQLYVPVVYNDYLGNIENIMASANALDTFTWTFDPGNWHTWATNNCNIGFGVSRQNTHRFQGVFQPAIVAHLATQITKQCSYSGENLGGFVRLGGRQEFIVILGMETIVSAGMGTS